jgi:AraC-like DNA-binding protein
MATIVALLSDATHRLDLESAIDQARRWKEPHLLAMADSWPRLQTLCRQFVPPLVVVGSQEARQGISSGALATLRATCPSTAVLVYGVADGLAPSDLVFLGELGARYLERSRTGSPLDLLEATRAALSAGMASEISRSLAGVLPDWLVPGIQFAVATAPSGPSPADLARVCNCSRATLDRRLRNAGLPTAESLLIWCRLLHAAALLRDQDRGSESTARSLGWSDASGLRHHLRRYAGMAVPELRRPDALDVLLGRFFEAVYRGREEG